MGSIKYKPEEYTGALRNPLKGFRGRAAKHLVADREKGKYSTLTKSYIPWNALENNINDGPDKIMDYCNKEWQGCERHNIKVIPRVYLEWPNSGDASKATVSDKYWPEDMTPGDYSSQEFKDRLVNLVKKLGQAWDHDHRVAFVEMGIIGYWGEHHRPKITPEMESIMGDTFQKNFRNKLVMRRYPEDFVDYDFGIYWDSFAHHNEIDHHFKELLKPVNKNKWKYCVRGGEMAFNWGDQLGDNPTDAVLNYSDEIIDVIRKLHWNHLGWVSKYKTDKEEVLRNAAAIQKSLGYRFLLESVVYDQVIRPKKPWTISLTVKNTGSSPFYYNWPLEVALLDPETKEPVWSSVFKDLDLREWLPGDDWNSEEKIYEKPACSYKVVGEFKIPSDLASKSESFIVSLSILDPAVSRPAALFAIKNYFQGGRHPLGMVSFGSSLKRYDIDSDQYDEPADNLLNYAE